MYNSPLVSVITPCFEDGPTLSMALASLVAQTMDDWECVIVDDGSTESIVPTVEAFDDPRFRIISFSKNQGRSAARQRGLEVARGRFICMLDADDWYFPAKLVRQLRVMEKSPELVAVATGAVVVNEEDALLGVRTFTPRTLEVRRGDSHRFPHFLFSTVMIRRESALAHEFDSRLERSEDRDYLMRVLAGQSYGIMPDVLYAYREYFSDRSMREALCGFRNQRVVFRDHFSEAPLEMGRQYLWSMVKTGIYGGARAVGWGKWLFSRRNRPSTELERREFLASKHRVKAILEASVRDQSNSH